jgi:hypothetical protein
MRANALIVGNVGWLRGGWLAVAEGVLLLRMPPESA